uniref:Uncharacterized protein n=1 Tax=Utricularia reniformis TaxID=192314 RepID=A0A1Y0B146_9LAMI|nr:hypothetical protein AEK19_MT0872 [Utricularia reniformis]ART31104.1 hypothetical protein AEK19_MT0872 [Utricularia reniformis]
MGVRRPTRRTRSGVVVLVFMLAYISRLSLTPYVSERQMYVLSDTLD